MFEAYMDENGEIVGNLQLMTPKRRNNLQEVKTKRRNTVEDNHQEVKTKQRNNLEESLYEDVGNQLDHVTVEVQSGPGGKGDKCLKSRQGANPIKLATPTPKIFDVFKFVFQNSIENYVQIFVLL
jgi:hypothetical protein